MSAISPCCNPLHARHIGQAVQTDLLPHKSNEKNESTNNSNTNTKTSGGGCGMALAGAEAKQPGIVVNWLGKLMGGGTIDTAAKEQIAAICPHSSGSMFYANSNGHNAMAQTQTIFIAKNASAQNLIGMAMQGAFTFNENA